MSLAQKMLETSEGGIPSIQDTANLWYGGELYPGDDFYETVFGGCDGNCSDSESPPETNEEVDFEVEKKHAKKNLNKMYKECEECPDNQTTNLDKNLNNESKFIGGNMPRMGGIAELAKQLSGSNTEESQFKKELSEKASQIFGGSKRKNNIEECSEYVTNAIRNFGAGLKL